ncbi:MAG: RRXRR domain-containing protein [Candidatus Schekmanbacteria bacterium]|nr:RRXRR domain-containing protein [Candidatus Schekmanbacteria bacterium]
MPNRVFVLDGERCPLMPCRPARARRLLRDGKAAAFRRVPFTIVLQERVGRETQPVEVKLDPGSKTTGVALVVHDTAEFAVESMRRWWREMVRQPTHRPLAC